MTTREERLPDAILTILKEAEEPLRADEIAHRIVANDLRQEAKVHSVNATLSTMFKEGTVIKPERALFSYNPDPSNPVSAEEIRKAEEDEQLNNICAYGLYWGRDKVNWHPGRGRSRGGLLGTAGDGTKPVDFSNQAGIYVLYNGTSPVYVGRTFAENNALMTRLVFHYNDDRKGARWDKFSWFGFRPVGDDGRLLTSNANVSTDLLIIFMEAVMIEAFLPPLNNKGGDLLGTMYEQVEDEALVEKRNSDFREMVARAQSAAVRQEKAAECILPTTTDALLEKTGFVDPWRSHFQQSGLQVLVDSPRQVGKNSRRPACREPAHWPDGTVV